MYIFITFHNFSMSSEHFVGFWQSESFISIVPMMPRFCLLWFCVFLPSDVSSLEKKSHCHLKNDANGMKFAFEMVPEFRGRDSGTCQFSGFLRVCILQEFKELLLAWDLSRVGFNGPGGFLRLDTAAEAKMTRYLKGWKRILDKDNTNRCNWYEFQDADETALIFFGWRGV